MGHRLTDDQLKLYRRIDEILFYIWDPIGISRSNWARDEYQSYLPKVFGMIMEKRPTTDIVDYLVHIEADHMGLERRPGIERRTEKVVTLLEEVRESILAHDTPK
jgi:hypothetical protein